MKDRYGRFSALLSEPGPGPPELNSGNRLPTRLLRLCHEAGITRIGDLTGLDRTGLPVVQAVRPAAMSEVTSLGRGVTRNEAAIGAVMEALETFFAERVAEEKTFTATADELEITQGKFEHQLALDGPREWRRIPLPWIMALNPLTGEEEPVPLELVHSRYVHPAPAGDGVFARTTTGLACHTSTREAFLHGLFECVERDAIARAFETHGYFDRYRIRLTDSIGPPVEHLLGIASAARIEAAFWYAPSPTGVPVVWCQTIEAGSPMPILALPTEGYAAAFTLDRAIRNALLEALATRAGAISGAREDQTRSHYNARPGSPMVEHARKLFRSPLLPLAPDQIEYSREGRFDDFVRRVAQSSLGPVLWLPLGGDVDAGVACVRVVLAGARAFTVVR